MELYRIAIVDDDSLAQDRLVGFVKKYEDENKVEFTIDKFSDGDELKDDYKCNYDIIFLDIEMKRVDGMKSAEYIRTLDKEVQIIFVTNSSQYAVEGYRVGALSYLLKPASYFMFCKELDRCLEELKRKAKEYLVLQTQNGISRVALDGITFIESFKHKIIYHTKYEKFETYGTMKDIEKELKDKCFFRCNSGYLVNMRHVEGIKDEEANVGGEILKISRSRKKEFMEALLAFYSRR